MLVANQLASPVKVGIMGSVLAAVTLPFLWPLAQIRDASVSRGAWTLVIVSAVANVLVIAWHYITPAHPKFQMVKWRKWVLRTHITSGTVELVAGLAACFLGSPTAAVVMACAALFFHVPTAFLQTPSVFGSKAVMLPSYVLCIVTHAFCAVMLLSNPTSTFWAVNTFLVFNVYVWCRIYFYVFDWLKLFSTMKYSIAILAAGATMMPALLGPLAWIYLMAFVGAWILLYRFLFAPTKGEYLDYVREKARDSAINRDVVAAFGGKGDEKESERAARQFFDSLDADKDGCLTFDEVRLPLSAWELPPAMIDDFIGRESAAGRLDFDRFLRTVWSIGSLRQRATRLVGTQGAATERDRAAFVFQQIDVQGEGRLSKLDLEMLLLEWGLPTGESARYLDDLDTDEDGLVDFDEFFRKMKPVWKFIYYDILRAEDTSRDSEMVGRFVTSFLDERKTEALRQTVKRELLSRVPFLQGATDGLVDDLASSLLEEPFPAGTTVFTEGTVGDKFYLVGSGVARVIKGDEVISDLGPGACLGDGALLTDQPHSATVVALTDSVFYSLTQSSFEFLIEKYPAVGENLWTLHRGRPVAANARTIQQELLERVPFLRGADAALTADLAGSLVRETFKPGDVVLREESHGDRLYLIEEGTVRITRAGQTITDIPAGECVGEGALLSDEPQSATVTALEDTRAFSLERAAFERILEEYPTARAEIFDLHRSRSQLVESAGRTA